MNLKLNIKNIGKLADAEISVANFTVFAGPNNTGKSFVSKLLYSFFNAMNANHAQIHLENLAGPVVNSFYKLNRQIHYGVGGAHLLRGESEVEKLESVIKDCSPRNSEELDEVVQNLINQTNEIAEKVTELKLPDMVKEASKEEQADPMKMVREAHDELKTCLNSLKEELIQTNLRECMVAGMKLKIRQNLIHNFQIPTLSALRTEDDAPSELMFQGFGKFEFSNDEIEFAIDEILVQELQQHSNVVYLESPVYWKLKNALEDMKRHPRRMFFARERELLSAVPEYFYDLLTALSFQRTGGIAFPDLYDKLTSEDVMGGKISISESGNLSFQENGRNFTLPVTAMGIVNMGILALLIERNVLDENTFIFIDEPEAHLHPAWQVIMAETLFELSRHGVNVVIATHSVDILKWLEVRVKKTPEDKQLVALNRFPINSSEVDDNFEAEVANVIQELTKPFYDLYLEGV